MGLHLRRIVLREVHPGPPALACIIQCPVIPLAHEGALTYPVGDVRVTISALEHTFRLASLVFFPAVAVWAWRAAGRARLWRATGIGLGLVVLLAAFAASAAGGNALAPVHGYGYTASRSLLAHGLTLGLPLLATTVAVQALAGSVSSRVWLYLVGVLGAALAWVVGVIAGMNVLAALA